jgi:hypothetical protein
MSVFSDVSYRNYSTTWNYLNRKQILEQIVYHFILVSLFISMLNMTLYRCLRWFTFCSWDQRHLLRKADFRLIQVSVFTGYCAVCACMSQTHMEYHVFALWRNVQIGRLYIDLPTYRSTLFLCDVLLLKLTVSTLLLAAVSTWLLHCINILKSEEYDSKACCIYAFEGVLNGILTVSPIYLLRLNYE